MELTNKTELEAALFHGPDGPRHHGVVVLFKQLLPLTKQPDPDFVWPILREEMKTELGTFPMDHHLPLNKMDMVVCGMAHAPKGQAVRALEIQLTVGSFSYRQHVFGDRTWQKRMLSYAATDPEPFTSMPLTLSQAYGGTLSMPYGDVPHPANHHGKGFLLEDVAAEGRPLPNLERPEHPLKAPYEMVEPTCMAPYPLGWKCRVDRVMGDQGVKPFSHEQSSLYFGIAHPDLMIDRPQPGTELAIHSMHPDHVLKAQVPQVPGCAVITIDGQDIPLDATLDGITVFAHRGWIGFKYRAAGRFELEARQSRSVRLEGAA